jgi:predicted secreted hydrolase
MTESLEFPDPVRRRGLLRGGALALATPGLLPVAAAMEPNGGDRAVPFPGKAVVYPDVRRDTRLVFPRDYGAHPDFRIEWWYVTGWLFDRADRRPCGFQITFFRIRTVYPVGNPSRFSPGRLMIAHAALVDPAARRHPQRERVANLGAAGVRLAQHDTDCALPGWTLSRTADDGYRTTVREDEYGWRLALRARGATAPWLQGEDGFQRKGPLESQASHYYSRPQLQVTGELDLRATTRSVEGVAWLDHEWSSTVLDPRAAGWDWAGLNLHDGRAIVWYRIRAADDGTALHSYIALREVDGAMRLLGEAAVSVDETWVSGATGSRYPVALTLAPRQPAPAGTGTLRLRPLIPNQEIDGRQITGVAYWEGAVRVLDDGDREIGLGYLELTGYHRAFRL